MTRKCTECGFEFDTEINKVCPECGCPVSEEATATNESEQPNNTASNGNVNGTSEANITGSSQNTSDPRAQKYDLVCPTCGRRYPYGTVKCLYCYHMFRDSDLVPKEEQQLESQFEKADDVDANYVNRNTELIGNDAIGRHDSSSERTKTEDTKSNYKQKIYVNHRFLLVLAGVMLFFLVVLLANSFDSDKEIDLNYDSTFSINKSEIESHGNRKYFEEIDETLDVDYGSYYSTGRTKEIEKVNIQATYYSFDLNKENLVLDVDFPLSIRDARDYTQKISSNPALMKTSYGPFNLFDELCNKDFLEVLYGIGRGKGSYIRFQFRSEEYDDYEWNYGNASDVFCNCLMIDIMPPSSADKVKIMIDGEEYFIQYNSKEKAIDSLVSKLGRYETVRYSGKDYYLWEIKENIWLYFDGGIFWEYGLVYTD